MVLLSSIDGAKVQTTEQDDLGIKVAAPGATACYRMGKTQAPFGCHHGAVLGTDLSVPFAAVVVQCASALRVQCDSHGLPSWHPASLTMQQEDIVVARWARCGALQVLQLQCNRVSHSLAGSGCFLILGGLARVAGGGWLAD